MTRVASVGPEDIRPLEVYSSLNHLIGACEDFIHMIAASAAKTISIEAMVKAPSSKDWRQCFSDRRSQPLDDAHTL